jgi:hypothetical protein
MKVLSKMENKVGENIDIITEMCIKENGETILKMEREQWIIPTVTDIKELGKTGKKTDKVNISIIMEPYTKEVSQMVKKVDLEQYFLLTELEFKLIGN